MSKKLNVTGKI